MTVVQVVIATLLGAILLLLLVAYLVARRDRDGHDEDPRPHPRDRQSGARESAGH